MEKNDHILDLIPEYILNCLDETETVQVYTHLANCSACREEVRQYETLAAQMPLAVPQIAPPDALRTRLLQSVKPVASQAKNITPAPHFSFWQWLQQVRFPALAGVSLIIILAFSNFFLWQQVDTLHGEVAKTDMLVQPLHALASDTASTGIMVMDPRGEYGTIIVDSLAPPMEGQEYQIWLSRDGKLESGGVFSIHDHGYGAKIVYASEPLINYTRVWVTLEPAGGSEKPTGVIALQTSP